MDLAALRDLLRDAPARGEGPGGGPGGGGPGAGAEEEGAGEAGAGAGQQRQQQHAVFLAPGSRGDFAPALAVAAALARAAPSGRDAARRPVRVTVAAHARYAAEVEALGLENLRSAELSGRDPEAARGAGAVAEGVEAERAWEQQLADYERLLLPATGHVDLVVFNFFALHVAHLCEARGLPGVALWQAPATPTGARPHFLVRGKLAAACRAALARARRKTGPGGAALPPDQFALGSYIFAEAMLTAPFARPLNAWRARLRLPAAPPGGAFAVLRRLRLPVLYTCSPALLGPPPKDWGGAGTAGATVAVVGDCLVAPAPGFAPEADLAAFLAAAATGGKQVALFTLGSGARALPRAAGLAAVSRVLRALRRQGFAVLVCAGLAPFLADDDGERLVVGRVPHGWLLPQVALAVHHGGAGTFHAACRAGCRQVVCPLEFDQPFWADLARARGVATVLDLTETLTDEAAVEAVRGACAGDGAAHRRLAAAMRAERASSSSPTCGPERAAAELRAALLRGAAADGDAPN